MKISAHEMSALPTNDADFANHPGIKQLKSGKWAARIHHPVTKIWLLLGIFSTPQEAADIYTRKKLKYQSRSVEEAPSSFHTNVIDIAKNPSIRRVRSRKWTPDNKHNIKSVWPSTYVTPYPSKIELNSSKIACLSKEEGSSISRCRGSGSVYQARIARSGNWQASIKVRNFRHYLGTYPTAEQAQEAINRKKCDLVLNAANQRPYRGTKTRSGRWEVRISNPITKARVHLGTFDTADEAEEAYNNKKIEFDLMVCAHRKRKWSNKRYEGDESFVCTDGLISVVEAIKEEENVKIMINVEVGSLPVHNEITGEFDLGIINSYGQLIGEFSRLDDELWLC